MLNCRQATQLLSERQDRPLNLNEKLSLNVHIGCAHLVGDLVNRSSSSVRWPSSIGRKMCRPTRIRLTQPMADLTVWLPTQA